MRFLELYQRLTGEEVEPLPSMLERCVICSEKAEVTQCAHCDKKVCEECKNAHVQIMQRELQRLNSQIRRALSRFNEELGQLKKCDDKLRFGCEQARSSIVDLAASLVCLIKEKEKQLLKELEEFQQSEESNLKKLREGLDEEYNNQLANCELIEKNVLNYSSTRQANQSNLNLSVLEEDDSANELIQWSDLELVEFRELFLKMLEFLRNFETLDGMEYARSALKLDVIKDLDNVRKQAANYASLKIQLLATEKLEVQKQMVAQLAAGIPIQAAGSPGYGQPLGSTHALNQTGTSQLNVPLQQSILMRSQSDHRLATQFAKKDLLQKQQAGSPAGKYGTANYGEHDTNNQYGLAGSTPTSHYAAGQSGTQYRSRFMREKNAELSAMHDTDDPYDPYAAHRVRFGAEDGVQQLNPAHLAAQLQSALKVFDTKEASRCPLSSIVKLNESSHFMERIDENKRKTKKLEKEKAETRAMSQPPAMQPSIGQNLNNPNQQPINSSLQHASLTSRQSPIQQHGTSVPTQQQQQQQQPQQQLLQNKAPPPNRQMSEDEIDKQKRLNKQFEMQSLNNNSSNLVESVNNSAPVQQLVSQQSQPRQQLQKQNSIHGPEPSIATSQLTGPNKSLVSKSLLTGGQPAHSRLNQTSSGPDDEEDEELEDSVEEDSDEEEDSALPGNARQVLSSTTPHSKLSGHQRPSFEESESKLMPVSALTDHHSDYSPSATVKQSLLNMGRTSSIERDYGQTTSSGYTSAGGGGGGAGGAGGAKLSRQNSANSSSTANQASFVTPRNSIDIGSTNYAGSRSNSFDRDSGSGYRYLTRANTRLDDLLNRDSYTNDSSSTSSNHNRFNRFNRLARSSTVSSLSPSYTGTTTSGSTSVTSGGSTSSGSSNYRTYDLDTNNYVTGGYSSGRSTDGANSSYSRYSSSPPPQSRTATGSSTGSSGLSRYGIGNSSVGTSSGYRRTSAYNPDSSKFVYFYFQHKQQNLDERQQEKIIKHTEKLVFFPAVSK